MKFHRHRESDAADHAIDRIVAGLDRLSQLPLTGRPRNELATGLRSYFTRPRRTVFYRIRNDWLEVVRVSHHARDLSGFFPDQ